MGKRFNVNGLCIPDKHYMVDISERLCQIKKMIDAGEYFTINRGRQYGKTTTLYALTRYLMDEYIVLFLDFQMLSRSDYESEASFVSAFARELLFGMPETAQIPYAIQEQLEKYEDNSGVSSKLALFFQCLNKWCALSEKPIVLMIDEVDNASNNQVFLDFLAQLRGSYLRREIHPTFQSVILASVYDIKNLKLRIRTDGEHQYNSPWNIAAKYMVDMSFSVQDIKGMLMEYETDYHTGMDTEKMAGMIYEYTSGYPYLVSGLCKIIDEQLFYVDEIYKEKQQAWSQLGVQEAVKLLLTESNTLFDDMRKKLGNYPELVEMLRNILFSGQDIPYNQYNHSIDVAEMFSYVINDHGKLRISNRIFETWIYNWFISEERMNNRMFDAGANDRSQFIRDGKLDMKRILERFIVHFTELYGDSDEAFIEKVGRKYFLFYLKPIINGTGNYYVEAETRDSKRTDVIVDYLGSQYIVELKIWHGEEYNRRGEEQLAEYLDAYHLDKGYMLSFCFNKKKDIGIREIQVKDKVLVEAVV